MTHACLRPSESPLTHPEAVLRVAAVDGSWTFIMFQGAALGINARESP